MHTRILFYNQATCHEGASSLNRRPRIVFARARHAQTKKWRHWPRGTCLDTTVLVYSDVLFRLKASTPGWDSTRKGRVMGRSSGCGKGIDGTIGANGEQRIRERTRGPDLVSYVIYEVYSSRSEASNFDFSFWLLARGISRTGTKGAVSVRASVSHTVPRCERRAFSLNHDLVAFQFRGIRLGLLSSSHNLPMPRRMCEYAIAMLHRDTKEGQRTPLRPKIPNPETPNIIPRW